ncbi:hypothetical protein [Streptomyces chartreusis]
MLFDSAVIALCGGPGPTETMGLETVDVVVVGPTAPTSRRTR